MNCETHSICLLCSEQKPFRDPPFHPQTWETRHQDTYLAEKHDFHPVTLLLLRCELCVNYDNYSDWSWPWTLGFTGVLLCFTLRPGGNPSWEPAWRYWDQHKAMHLALVVVQSLLLALFRLCCDFAFWRSRRLCQGGETGERENKHKRASETPRNRRSGWIRVCRIFLSWFLCVSKNPSEKLVRESGEKLKKPCGLFQIILDIHVHRNIHDRFTQSICHVYQNAIKHPSRPELKQDAMLRTCPEVG